MTIRMTDELREAVNLTPNVAVRIYDVDSDTAYVLIPEAVYERLATMLDDGEFADTPYAHVSKLIGADGLGDEETVV